MEKNVETYRIYLEDCLKKSPADLDALVKLGILEFKYFHDHEKAVNCFETAIKKDPKNVDAKFWLAACLYYDYCEYEKAELVLMEALQVDPNRADCLSLMGWIIQDTNRSIDIAIEYVTKAIQYVPNWPMLRCQLATFYITQGDLIAAEKEINRMFQISPMDQGKIVNEVERYYEWVVTGRS